MSEKQVVEEILFKDKLIKEKLPNPLIQFVEKLGLKQSNIFNTITNKTFDQQLNAKIEEEKTEQVHVRFPKDFIQIERYLEETIGIYSKNKIYGTAIEHGICIYMNNNFSALRNIYHLRNRLILSDNDLANQLYEARFSTPLKSFFKDLSKTPSTVRIQPSFKFLLARLTDETHISQSDLCRNAIVYSLFTSQKATALRTKFNKIIQGDLQFIKDYTAFLETNVAFFTDKSIPEIRKELYGLRVKK